VSEKKLQKNKRTMKKVEKKIHFLKCFWLTWPNFGHVSLYCRATVVATRGGLVPHPWKFKALPTPQISCNIPDQ